MRSIYSSRKRLLPPKAKCVLVIIPYFNACLYFYTQQTILKPAKLIMPQGPRQSRKKVRDDFKGGGGGSRGQNRYVTLP